MDTVPSDKNKTFFIVLGILFCLCLSLILVIMGYYMFYSSDNKKTSENPSEKMERDDPCKNINCGENGTCKKGKCRCNIGYSGKFCQISSNTPNSNPVKISTNTIIDSSSPNPVVSNIDVPNGENDPRLCIGVVCATGAQCINGVCVYTITGVQSSKCSMSGSPGLLGNVSCEPDQNEQIEVKAAL